VDTFIADYTRIMPAAGAAPHPATRAIEGARAIDRDERQAEAVPATCSVVGDGLLAVTSLSRAMSGEARVADLGALFWTILGQVLPCDSMAIFILDVETDEIAARYAAGAHAHALRQLRRASGTGIAAWCAANRRSALNADPSLDIGLRNGELNPALRACLSVPLVEGEAVAGVLALYRAERDGFSEDDLRLVELLAPRLAHSLGAAIDGEHARQQPAQIPQLALVRGSRATG
jgi:GAF domain-containing protein